MSSVDFNYAGAIADAQILALPRPEAEVVAELDAACLKDGLLQPMPAAFYASRLQVELAAWCVRRGFYCLPTTELIDWLREQIAGDTAIEIGAGNGAIGRALGIPITDSRQQEHPELRRHYEAIGQGVTHYPPDVEKLTAMEAAEKYRPSVIIAAWVTWRYNPNLHRRGGNAQGVDELKLFAKPFVDRYIHIAHERVHARSPLRDVPHTVHRHPWLFARPMDPLNVVWDWHQ